MFFCQELLEVARTPWKFNDWLPPFHREGHLAISLKLFFDGNYMKCTEMHETNVFQFPILPHRVGKVRSSAQNNAMSITNKCY